VILNRKARDTNIKDIIVTPQSFREHFSTGPISINKSKTD